MVPAVYVCCRLIQATEMVCVFLCCVQVLMEVAGETMAQLPAAKARPVSGRSQGSAQQQQGNWDLLQQHQGCLDTGAYVSVVEVCKGWQLKRSSGLSVGCCCCCRRLLLWSLLRLCRRTMSCRSGSTRCAPHEHQHTALQGQPQRWTGAPHVLHWLASRPLPRRSLSFCHHRRDNSIRASDRAAQLMLVSVWLGRGGWQELPAVG